jgi:eukaryotic-like serine/threonine-protein kinase
MRDVFKLEPHTWAELRMLLGQALEVPAPERDRWLAALDPALSCHVPRLRALLAHARDGGSGSAMASGPMAETGPLAHMPLTAHRSAEPGDVGPYRLLRELGSGGMASVWLAERTDMLQRRQVALKLPHGAWRRAGLAERMAREREILATLQHPNIATLYDAGLGDDGQPYLALEYVEGERIDHCAERLGLDVPATVRLFLQVVRAVAHAHAHLVVHRDLKPNNILVTAAGDVKLLDFGIAKLLDQGSAEESELTRQSGRAMTPAYAAPEQILGQPIGTPADVYALGVVLFELLAGRRPYALDRGSRAALEDAIVQADPPRPSAVAPPSRRAALRGDLDTIVLKALHKDAGQRYATADALAEDLLRHLEHRPVLAQPDRAGYRMARFVRRNRLAVGTSTAIVAALAIGAGVAAWQAVQARAEQRRAEAVKSFVTGLFADANPFATASSQPTVEGLLQSALARLKAQPTGDGALRVELLEIIGSALTGLGRYEQAALVLRQAIDEGSRSLGAGHRLSLRARVTLTEVYRHSGRTAEMKAELDDVLPRLRAAGASMPEELVAAMKNRAHLAIEQGRMQDAQATAHEALALADRWLGPDHPETADAALVVAAADQFGSDPQQLLASTARAVEAVSRAFPQDPPHAKVLDARFAHGRALGNAGRFDEAVTALQPVLQTVREQLGADAVMAGFVAADLSRFELALGHADTSLQHAQAALSVLERTVQGDSYTVAMAHLIAGRAALALYRADDARRSLDRARPGLVAARGEASPLLAELSTHHAFSLALLGQLDDAWQEVGAQMAGIDDLPALLKYRLLHAAGLVQRFRGDLDRAQSLQDQALSVLPAGESNAGRRAGARDELARIWLERGEPAKALALVPPQSPEPAPRSAAAAQRLLTQGRALLALTRPAEALSPLLQAADFWRRHGAGSPWEAEAIAWQQRAVAASN